MTTITVESLTTPVTKDQALQAQIDNLAALGFSSTSWQEGSDQRILLETWALSYSKATESIVNIAKSGFNDTAEGNWLTLHSISNYDNERKPAVATEGKILLTNSSGSPHTIDTGANQVTVADENFDYKYRNIDGGTLAAGGTLELTFRADVAQAAGDVAPDTITVLDTSLAGVTVSNPIPAGEDTWITINGADEESDEALPERNRLKWTTLSPHPPGQAYTANALDASASVTRAVTDDQNPRGPGTIDTIVAGQGGPVGSGVVTAVTEYMDGTTDGVDRVGTGADWIAKSAVQFNQIVSGTVYVETTKLNDAKKTEVAQAIADFYSGLPIGGEVLQVGDPGVVPFSGLMKAVSDVDGVRSFVPTSPTADVVLETDQVAVPTPVLTFQAS